MQKINRKLILQYYTMFPIIFVAIWLLIWIFTHSFVNITVNPNTATVTIDNAPVKLSRSGTTEKVFSVGTHQIQIEAEGHTGVSENISFRRAIPQSITINLNEVPKSFSVGEGKMLSVDSDNNFYYLGNQGTTIYKGSVQVNSSQSLMTSIYPITQPSLSSIKEIIWSPDHSLALLREADGIYLFDFQKYDFVHQSQTLWGKNIGSIAWAPDNSKIAYFNASAGTLIFSDIANTDPMIVANLSDLGISNPKLIWTSDSSRVIIIPQNSDSSSNKIFSLDRYSRVVSDISSVGNQIDASSSPDGSRLIYSTFSRDPDGYSNILLSQMQSDGSQKKSLDIRTNLSEVAWSSNNHIIVSAYDPNIGKQKLFSLNLDTDNPDGAVLTDFSANPIDSLKVIDSGKIVLYQAKGNIFAMSVQ